MLTSLHDALRLSEAFGVNIEDVLLIAVNAYGLANSAPSRRMRLMIALEGREVDPVHLIPSFGRNHSPFSIRENNTLLLGNDCIGHVIARVCDDVMMGYWRNHFRNLTLNTNSRSDCAGCIFCYTHLDPASDPRITIEQELSNYLSFVCTDRNWRNLSNIDTISVCSGCFVNEIAAIRHMQMVKDVAARYSFYQELHLLTSVIRSGRAIDYIASHLMPFHLTLTIECFENRDEYLKSTKACLEIDEIEDLMEATSNRGISTDYTYLIGLDPLNVMEDYVWRFLRHTTTFPRFQIFQPHNSLQASCRAHGADTLEFYLDARRRLEQVFEGSELRPKSWENYRPLWYYTFGGKSNVSTRI